jgi:hypothetical protein
MIGAIFTFVFLWALIFLFERQRDDLDAFSIAGAVVVPTILVFVAHLGLRFAEIDRWTGLIEILVLVVATYLVLTMSLAIRRTRALAYTSAILVFNFALGEGMEIVTGAA